MPSLAKAKRRDAQRQNQPPRHMKMSRQGLRASRQARRALETRYGVPLAIRD